MAKRKRPVDQEFSTIDMDGDKPVRSPVQDDAGAAVADKIQDRLAGTGDVKQEVAEKLEQFEKMQGVVADLTTENQALKERLAEYIQREAASSAKGAADEKLASLREENDQYLMRISELTFENAKLQSQLDEARKAQAQARAQAQAPVPAQAR